MSKPKTMFWFLFKRGRKNRDRKIEWETGEQESDRDRKIEKKRNFSLLEKTISIFPNKLVKNFMIRQQAKNIYSWYIKWYNYITIRFSSKGEGECRSNPNSAFKIQSKLYKCYIKKIRNKFKPFT